MECMEKVYKLIDSSHPRFNRYDVLLNGEVIYQECFMKEEDPNVFLAWRKWNNEKRSHYIRKCIANGELFEETLNRLKIHHHTYTFYKNKLWAEGKTISDYREMISKINKTNGAKNNSGRKRGPYKRRKAKTEGVVA